MSVKILYQEMKNIAKVNLKTCSKSHIAHTNMFLEPQGQAETKGIQEKPLIGFELKWVNQSLVLRVSGSRFSFNTTSALTQPVYSNF